MSQVASKIYYLVVQPADGDDAGYNDYDINTPYVLSVHCGSDYILTTLLQQSLEIKRHTNH